MELDGRESRRPGGSCETTRGTIPRARMRLIPSLHSTLAHLLRTLSLMHKVERGLFELRRGRALYVSSSASAVPPRLSRPSTASRDQTLEQLRSLGGPLRLVVTYHRGRAIGLAAKNGRVPPHLSLGLNGDASPSGILRLATTSAARLAEQRD